MRRKTKVTASTNKTAVTSDDLCIARASTSSCLNSGMEQRTKSVILPEAELQIGSTKSDLNFGKEAGGKNKNIDVFEKLCLK